MNQYNWKKIGLLLLTAMIWGVAFVAQSVGMDYVECFTFNAVRNMIGALVLLPVIWWMGRRRVADASDEAEAEKKRGTTGDLILGGILCGILLCVATNLQQYGIQYTTAGKAGFITALYIVIVPLLGLFLKKTCGLLMWISVFIAVIGFYLLSIKEGFTLGTADLYILLAAFVFSMHILVIDHFSPKVDGVKMACIQFFVCSLLSGVGMFAFETPTWSGILQAWLPLLYAGALSCGVAYTLQIVAQKDFNPTVASLLLSLEAVFSVLAGWVILGEVLSFKELAGCLLIFGGVILAQLPAPNKSNKKSEKKAD
jgi:drug/metabolite transporter (DMT)-like permease